MNDIETVTYLVSKINIYYLHMTPSVGFIFSSIKLRSVLFPAPFGPTNAILLDFIIILKTVLYVY